MRLCAILVVLLAARGAAAQDAILEQGSAPQFGLAAGAGVPGGAALAGVFRPWPFLRGEAGLNWNYVGFGVRGGVSYIPFEWGVTPTLNLEGGHFFSGDASSFVGNDRPGVQLLLRDVREDFVTASVGLEVGSQQRFVFFLRLGMSWIWSGARNVQQAIALENAGSASTVKSAGDISLLLRTPTASLGVILFLL
jgi:hypothetical protein